MFHSASVNIQHLIIICWLWLFAVAVTPAACGRSAAHLPGTPLYSLLRDWPRHGHPHDGYCVRSALGAGLQLSACIAGESDSQSPWGRKNLVKDNPPKFDFTVFPEYPKYSLHKVSSICTNTCTIFWHFEGVKLILGLSNVKIFFNFYFSQLIVDVLCYLVPASWRACFEISSI